MNNQQILPITFGKREIVFQKGMGPLLFLLEVDPYHFYACWEISPEELSIIIDQIGGFFHQSQLILRVYEGNNFKNDKVEIGSYFDVFVDGWKNKWYIEISKPHTSYFVELGLKASTLDDFYVIKRSNVIKTPQNTMSSNKQEQWIQVLGEYEEVNMVKGDQKSAKGLSLDRAVIDRKIIQEYYKNLWQRDWREISPEWPEKGQIIGQGAPENITGFGFVTKDNPGFPPETGNSAKTENLSSYLPWSSYNLSSEIPSSFSSFSLLSSWQPEENADPNRSFQYGTDLVVYGKTQPEAVLYIDGDKVEIRADGTFSWRLNLSREGHYQIPLQVVFQGGEEICEFIPFHIQKSKKNGD